MFKKIGRTLLVGLCVFAVGCATGQVPNEPNEVFRLMVDYDKSLEEMIAAGKDSPSPDGNYSYFNEERFPKNAKGNVEVDLELIHFKEGFFTIPKEDFKKISVALQGRGLRPATLPELLALGEQYPNLQLKYPIVALGSICEVTDEVDLDGQKSHLYYHYLPYLTSSDENGRFLDFFKWPDPEYLWARIFRNLYNKFPREQKREQWERRVDTYGKLEPRARFAAVRVHK